jgi:hypothetical protein
VTDVERIRETLAIYRKKYDGYIQAHALIRSLEAAADALELYADPCGPGEDSNFCMVNLDLHEVHGSGETRPIGATAKGALTKIAAFLSGAVKP